MFKTSRLDVEPLKPGPIIERKGRAAPYKPLLGAVRPPEGQRLYALLDGALHHELPDRLRLGAERFACLHVDLNAAPDAPAPWLAELAYDAPLTRQLLTEGSAPWQGWARGGVGLLHATEALQPLCDHLGTVFRLMRIDGTRMLFRFWAADIIEALLAGLNDYWPGPARLFGPGPEPMVRSYVMPDPLRKQVLVARAPDRLPRGALLADERFEAIMNGVMQHRFAYELAAHCTMLFPDTLTMHPPEARATIMALYATAGNALGLTQRGPLHVWAEASVLLGGGLAHDPLLAERMAPVLDRAASQMTRAERLHGLLVGYSEQVLGPRATHLRAALRRLRKLGPEGAASMPLDRLVQQTWPERIAYFGAEATQAFLADLERDHARLVSPDRIALTTYGILCFILGRQMWQDPMHAWAHPALAEPANRGADSMVVRVARRYLDAAYARME